MNRAVGEGRREVDVTGQPVSLRVMTARDGDPQVAAQPGMVFGATLVDGQLDRSVDGWVAQGVRHVALPGVVDAATTDPHDVEVTVRSLRLVRELTAHAMTVDWQLHLSDAAEWTHYSHLYPPATLTADEGVPDVDDWRRSFYLGKCVHRRGPGFIQIRDRRSGRLVLLTMDDPAYLAVRAQLDEGARVDEVDPGIARHLADEHLVARIGDVLVWLPYRLRRWPLPAMVV